MSIISQRSTILKSIGSVSRMVQQVDIMMVNSRESIAVITVGEE